jgi:predicted carbohydrate-binding protein with CBM5 and CBM33 domain
LLVLAAPWFNATNRHRGGRLVDGPTALGRARPRRDPVARGGVDPFERGHAVRATKVVAGLGAGTLAVVSFLVLTNRSPVEAHGGMTFPSTRTHACYVNGREGSGGGDLEPTNAACRAAVDKGGKQPLWDWFGNLLSDAGSRSREIIPDGKLCGPSEKYDAYNAARADWPTTNVQAGAMVTLRYNAWAPHPGTWTQWATKDGFDVTKPLKWSDLDAQPFSVAVNPPINGSGAEGAEYTWPAKLPNKSGRHIIYSIWTRSDSPEVFYNCSDVNFGGATAPSTPAPTTATTRPTTATTSRPTTATTPPPSTAPATGPTTTTTLPMPPHAWCHATVAVSSTWDGGYLAVLTVSNPGPAPMAGWKTTLGLAPGAAIVGNWGGSVAGDVVSPAWWNGTSLANGQTSTIWLWVSGSPTPAPTVRCTF